MPRLPSSMLPDRKRQIMSPHAVSDQLQKSIDAIAAMEADAHVLAPTFEERAEQIALACRSAASMLQARRSAGISDPEPDPWPPSTWEFLAKHARRFQ
jgi:hypothetical protein